MPISLPLTVLVHLIVDVLDLVLGDLHVDAAEGVDDLDKAVKVDDGVTVDLDTEVGFDRLDRQLRTADGVGGVDLIVAVAGDIHIGVALKRGELELLVTVVHRHQDHGIGSAVVVLALVVLTEQHDVEHLAVLQQLSVADGQLGTASGELSDGGGGGAGVVRFVRRLGDVHEVHGVEHGVIIDQTAAAQEQQNRQDKADDTSRFTFFIVNLENLGV